MKFVIKCYNSRDVDGQRVVVRTVNSLEHQFSSPFTPPQNGMVERKTKNLCDMARTMLDEHRTSRRFWAEEVNTACYVSNMIILQVLKKKT
jgi:hypothetical protein